MSNEAFFIINPNANSGRLGKNIEKILKITKEYVGDFEYAFTENPRDEVEIAEKAIQKGYKIIAALGGDGTATNIGDVLVNHPNITLGLLSAGSMCDIHRTHSIPYDLESSLEIFAAGYTEVFPAIKCLGDKNYYALDMADGGFTAKAAAAAVYEMKWMKVGAIKYNYLAVKYVLKSKNLPCKIMIDDQEPIQLNDLTNAFAAVGDVIAGYDVLPGNPYFSQKNNDLGIVIVHGMLGLRRLKMLLKASSGNHVGMKGIWLTRGRKLVIETDEDPLCWTAEGEVFNTTGSRAEMERVDNALRIIVPKDREYTYDYDESIYQEKFEESFKERKIERIRK